jgi:uncharacterized membrane protein
LRNNAHASFATAVALGLGIYGVYNLTNMATLDNYSWKVAMVDTAWGVFSISALWLFYKKIKTIV